LLGDLQLTDLDLITYGRLIEAYGATDRYYHSLNHIEDCLAQLRSCRKLTDNADQIALAFWFHDAVYHWNSSTNEQDSADWAASFLAANKASAQLLKQVTDLILATRHFEPNMPTRDCKILVDIDLSILGRDADAYRRYERAIAQEYARVPKVLYRRGRRAVLRSFLERERIYQTDYFHHLYEVQARRNIQQAIRMV